MKLLHGWGDPKHEAGKLIQWITKAALRETEGTGARHADDNHVELDYEAVALANVTGCARSTVLKVKGSQVIDLPIAL